jgi:hypothetical protein
MAERICVAVLRAPHIFVAVLRAVTWWFKPLRGGFAGSSALRRGFAGSSALRRCFAGSVHLRGCFAVLAWGGLASGVEASSARRTSALPPGKQSGGVHVYVPRNAPPQVALNPTNPTNPKP